MRLLENIGRNIESKIKQELDSLGFFYRIFGRVKNIDSARNKIEFKNYAKHGKKLQDSIGIRVILYFPEDIQLVKKILIDNFVLDNKEEDDHGTETFKPQRFNYVSRIPEKFIEEYKEIISSYDLKDVDETFEVQLRTVFSEGWHEVEHDLRYKCKEDWEDHQEFSRVLNGIYATLETSEWSMLKLFDSISYKDYNNNKWDSMLRNKFRLRFTNTMLNPDLIAIFNSKPDVVKEIFKTNRNRVLTSLYEKKIKVPLTISNLVFIINHLELRNDDISKKTPKPILEILEI
jgi:ppGpp synthetase/RelA/SpoT-type nucleotidyltranferase